MSISLDLGLSRSKRALLGAIVVTFALLTLSLVLVQPPSASGSPSWIDDEAESPLSGLGRVDEDGVEQADAGNSDGSVTTLASLVR